MENRTTSHSENDHLIWVPRPIQVEEAEKNSEIQDYGSINNTNGTTSFCHTFLASIWTSFTINLATIPLGLLIISALYFDINIANICFEQKQRENSLPRNIMKWVLAGHIIEVMALHFWFQLFLVLLFTSHQFMSRHPKTLLISLLQGCIVSVYKTVLFIQNVDFTLDRYRYTGNVVFLLGVTYTGYVVSKKICKCRPTDGLKKFQVFKIITTQYFMGAIIVMVFRYLIIPWFVSAKNETTKAIIAAIVLFIQLIMNIMNEQVALSSSEFVKPERNFIFISFFIAVTSLLFSVMKADVRSISIFTALCLYHSIIQIILAATEKLRDKLLSAVRNYLRCCYCCRQQRLTQQDGEECNSGQLKVNKYIQFMLNKNSALIVGQAYEALYLVSNFYTNPWNVFAEPLIRVAIGTGVNLLSNAVSIFIHVYWYDSKLPTVWTKTWRLHLTTVALGGVMIVFYLTVVLLTVVEGPQQGLVIKNCTVPYS